MAYYLYIKIMNFFNINLNGGKIVNVTYDTVEDLPEFLETAPILQHDMHSILPLRQARLEFEKNMIIQAFFFYLRNVRNTKRKY